MNDQTPILETRDLNKYFYLPEKFQVLRHINLQIHRGELCSIVGASGSGKSTLLYLLSTLDTDYEGTILMDGIDLKQYS